MITSEAIGVGWRQPHYLEVMSLAADTALKGVDFLEVHAENFLAGGASRQLLGEAAARHPISLHGVGLGLGSASGLDTAHLRRLRALAEVVDPVLMSEHACFSQASWQGRMLHAQDLLPLPFNRPTLRLLSAHVDQAQQVLGRQLLIENLSALLTWADDDMPQPAFFNALAQATGCGVLLDLNNLVVNALNAGLDEGAAVRSACAWVDAIDPDAVGQFHLAGHARLDGLVIDDHGSRVPPCVWTVYRHALRTLGPRPTLIEWDTDVPAWSVLVEEAAHARTEQARVLATATEEALHEA